MKIGALKSGHHHEDHVDVGEDPLQPVADCTRRSSAA